MQQAMLVLFTAVLILGQAEAHSVVTRGLQVEVPAKAKTEAAAVPAKTAAVPAKAKSVTVVPAKAAALPAKVPAKAVAAAALPAKPKSATPPTPAKVHAVPKVSESKVKVASLITPPLKDVKSDKKFFGPPFPADYPDDQRPAIKKSILDKLKGPDQPYPALQSKADFDRDYVKDENSDKGSWHAQFEYDALRKKIAKEEADEKAAEDRASKEGKDVDDAQKKVDDAAKKAKDAKDGADEAAKDGQSGAGADQGEEGSGKDGLPPTQESLEKLKKKVAEAEANYEKEKKDFEECKRQLEEAKKQIEELKASQAEMEKQLSAETKLWAESKKGRETVRFNLKKAKEEVTTAKIEAAQAHLKVALNNKADVDKVLAVKKAESDKANATLQKQKAQLEQAKKDLEKATVRLQKLRGYTPKDATATKSGATNMNVGFALAALVACVGIGYA